MDTVGIKYNNIFIKIRIRKLSVYFIFVFGF